MKVVDYSRGSHTTREAVELEVQILRDLQGIPHVVKLHRSYLDAQKDRAYILFE